MSRFKSLLIALTALVFFAPGIALAQSQHSSGDVTIQVVDQNGRDISGVWYLYEGSGTQGMISRNGTWGETFGMNYGTYFLVGQSKSGYDSFEITSENPQTVVPNGNIMFTLVYHSIPTYNNPPAAPQEQPAAPVVEEETPAPAPNTNQGATSSSSTLPPRTPLQVDQPLTNRLSYTGQPVGVMNVNAATASADESMQLATTGPEGLASLLGFSTLLSGLWITRRRRA